jgi:hypothetical protein
MLARSGPSLTRRLRNPVLASANEHEYTFFACLSKGHDFSSFGPTLPPCSVQEVGSFLGNSRRTGDEVGMAARDPCRPDGSATLHATTTQLVLP